MADPTKPPTPTLAALGDIDGLIAAQIQLIQQQAKASRKSILLANRQFRAERKENREEMKLLRKQIAASRIEAPPPVARLSMPEVESARRQVAIDAGARMGVRKSILAGETGFAGSAGGSAPRRSILG